MAFQESTAPAPPAAASSSTAGDSYIGTSISLISKSEMRYEGVVAAINQHDSTIALQSVRSYGTEGRKKDGLQIPPSNKLYDCILFRGSDVKELQVNSSAPRQTQSQMGHDPAIIQSHYANAPTSYPSPVSSGGGTLAGTSSYVAQSTTGNLPFPDAYSSHQTGGHPGSWISSDLSVNTTGASFTAPMYFQGYNAPSTGQSHIQAIQQHSVPFRPPPVMQQNQLQHPEGHAPTSMPTLSGFASSLNFYSTASPSPSSIPNPAELSFPLSSTNSFLSTPLSSLPSHLPTLPPISPYNQELNISMNPISSKAGVTATSLPPDPSLPCSSSIIRSASGPLTTVSLLAPNHLSKSELLESSSLPKLYPEQKNMPMSSVNVLPQAPLLPLPLPSQQGQQPVAKFNEEFDFTAMNEMFKKDEVWGSLGKAKQTLDQIYGNVDFEGGCDQDPRFRNKPVYDKDNFFDNLSCTSLNRGGSANFAQRMRLDTETFGGFQQRPPPGVGRGNYGPSYLGNFGGFQHRPPVGRGNFGPAYIKNASRGGSYSRGSRDYGYYGGQG